MTRYALGVFAARLREPDPPPYKSVATIVRAAPQLDGTVVRLARLATGVWRIDVTRRGREIYTRAGGRAVSDVRRLVRCAQEFSRDRGSEILVCPHCGLPLSAIKETTALSRSTGSLAHVECPDLFEDGDGDGNGNGDDDDDDGDGGDGGDDRLTPVDRTRRR